MTVHYRINVEGALAADDPVRALRDAVAVELTHGADREDLLEQLDECRQRLEDAGDEGAEDVVMTVMDFLTGFASPHVRL